MTQKVEFLFRRKSRFAAEREKKKGRDIFDLFCKREEWLFSKK